MTKTIDLYILLRYNIYVSSRATLVYIGLATANKRRKKMTLKDFNFNFKPKYVIRLIINNKDLEIKVLNFNFYNRKNELYNLLVRVYGSCMDVTRIEIPNYSSVTSISVNCSNAVYDDILEFLYRKGCR